MGWYDRFLDKTVWLLYREGPIGSLRASLLEEIYHIRIDRRRPRWPFFVRFRSRFRGEFQVVYFTALFSMLAKMARADGGTLDQEVAAIEEFMQTQLALDARQKSLAMQIMRRAKGSGVEFDEYARQYYELFEDRPIMLENLVDVLLAVAHADGCVTFSEEKLIKAATRIFGMGDADLMRLKTRHTTLRRLKEDLDKFRARIRGDETRRIEESARPEGERYRQRVTARVEMSELERAYALLGCCASDSQQRIKESYRKLAQKHHPDKLSGKGLPEEFLRFSEKHFREINDAYEEIKRNRGWS